jgi:hypothetical protein
VDDRSRGARLTHSRPRWIAAPFACQEQPATGVAECRNARFPIAGAGSVGVSDLPHRDSDGARAASDRARTSCLCTECNGSGRVGLPLVVRGGRAGPRCRRARLPKNASAAGVRLTIPHRVFHRAGLTGHLFPGAVDRGGQRARCPDRRVRPTHAARRRVRPSTGERASEIAGRRAVAASTEPRYSSLDALRESVRWLLPPEIVAAERSRSVRLERNDLPA